MGVIFGTIILIVMLGREKKSDRNLKLRVNLGSTHTPVYGEDFFFYNVLNEQSSLRRKLSL